MGPFRRKILIYFGIILLCVLYAAKPCSGSKIIRTSAKTLAERAGAAQYAVHIEEELTSEEIGGNHDVKKRLTTDNNAFDDSDYEIYQGVVGRPGIDFPILAGIPLTTFNCRKFGNGYFADLETDCQVFHICEGGKKISFLCPNGTIFQQTDLICDWWFKVNCAGSVGHYAESSEVLSRAQHRPATVPLNTYVEGGDLPENRNKYHLLNNGLNENRKKHEQTRTKAKEQYELISNDNLDFEDIDAVTSKPKSPPIKRARTNSNRNIKDTANVDDKSELQEVAESASFVNPQNSFNGYNYPSPNSIVENPGQTVTPQPSVQPSTDESFKGYNYEQPSNDSSGKLNEQTTTTKYSYQFESSRTTLPANGYNNQKPNNFAQSVPAVTITQPTVATGYNYEKPDRNSKRLEGSRTNNGFRLDNTDENSRKAVNTSTTLRNVRFTTVKPIGTIEPTTSPRRGTTTFQSRTTASGRQDRKQNIDPIRSTPNSITVDDNKPTTAAIVPRKRPSTFTTARRLETSRTTPFYTPTVPSLSVHIPSSTYVTPKISDILLSTTHNTSSVSEHAMEMMKTVQELHLDFPTEDNSKGSRPGLIIPPSSGPDTLHSLALYFATAVDNLVVKQQSDVAKTEESTAKPELVEVNNATIESSLLSNKTIDKYEKLFGIEKNTTIEPTNMAILSRMDNEENQYTDSNNDLQTEYSNNPIHAAAGTKQIRELAQVFTHALSAYLHDPATFRRVLSEIRPTEPTPTQNYDIFTNRIGHTDEFNKGTGPTYLPTQSTQADTGNLVSTTEDLEVLDFSDVTLSTLKKDATTTLAYQTTDEATISTTEPETTTFSNIIQESLNSVDHIPASRFLTERLEKPIEHIVSNTETSTFSNTIHKSLDSVDHVPGSRLLTDVLEKSANSRESKKLFESTTESNNPFAMEINGGLIVSTSFPYFQDDSLENINQTNFEDSNYFPVDRVEKNETYKPYGHNVRPTDNLPYSTVESDDAAVSWGGETTTEDLFTTTDSSFGLSYELQPPSNSNYKNFGLPADDILPPTIDDNDLQRLQSQSILASRNRIVQENKGRKFEVSTARQTTTTETPTSTSLDGHYITQEFPSTTLSPDFNQKSTLPDTGKFSPNPWSTLAYTVFLDPLTINHGLMNGGLDSTVTPSPNTYLPRSTQTVSYGETSTTEPTTTEQYALRGSFKEDDRQAKLLPSKKPDEYIEVMQKKATEMFGSLNDTSASHLLNVMKKANKNKTVRKLILLLIQTCDDDYNTTVEESRTALLNALIGMDGKLDEEHNEFQIINSRHNRRGKSIESQTGNAIQNVRSSRTTTDTPITTFRRPLHFSTTSSTSAPLFESTTTYVDRTTDTSLDDRGEVQKFENFYINLGDDVDSSTVDFAQYQESTTTNQPPTTTISTTTTTTEQPTTTSTIQTTTTRQQRIAESKRISKDLDEYLGQASQSYDETNSNNRPHKHSDTRALDLLRSLYSLAGRFGRRR